VIVYLLCLLIAGAATSFVLKQKKQKFKSPPACFFSHKAFTLQSRAAPQAAYILLLLRAFGLGFCKI